MAGKIINQAGGHGGARAGSGRPKGSRDRKALESHADVAAVIARIAVDQLVLLSPEDVLRLAMLLAVRRGDLDTATAHARRLVLSWQPWMGVVPGKGVQGGSRSAAIVNRLVEELHQVLVSGDRAELDMSHRPAAAPGSRRKRGATPGRAPGG